MKRKTGQADRLEKLKVALAERDHASAADLAMDLGVSLRTLYRDLAVLHDFGVFVDVGGDAWEDEPGLEYATDHRDD